MLHLLAVILSHMFFKKITITGQPYTGKTALWVVNHSNGIVDPTVLIALAPVLLRPLAKAPLWNNPAMRFFLKLTRAIPVARPQDFEEISKRLTAQTEQQVWQKKINTEAFKSVNQALLIGERILIFPEGVSHDSPYLHEFKTGVARMAVEAVSAGASVVTIQPAIIDYSEKNEFRSSLYLQYCEPVLVTENESSIPNIMEKLLHSFHRYFVSFRTWDEKRNWQYLFQLVFHRTPDSLEEFYDFVQNHRACIESDPVLLGKIQTMRCMMQISGVLPTTRCWEKALSGNQNFFDWFGMFFVRIFSFTLIKVPVMLVYTLVWGIPLELCRFLGENSKKYKRDVYATMAIAHSLWILPLWASLISGLFTMLIWDINAAPLNLFTTWMLFFLFTPAILLIGLFVDENLNFCAGHFRFGILKLTFPRGLEEMINEWKTISDAVKQKINR